MSLKRLQSGFFQGSEGQNPEPTAEVPSKLTKRAILCYEGEFESMDGPVSVSKDALTRLATNHNSKIETLSKLSESEAKNSMKEFPPLQLDHSTSAKDTVGRMTGKLELGPYVCADGTECLGLYGDVTVLGKENVEKVLDGRWTHLSVGVDFEKGYFSELTITPFPAAPEASMLSKLGTVVKRGEIEGFSVVIKEGAKGYFYVEIDGKSYGAIGSFKTANEAWQAVQREFGKGKLSSFSRLAKQSFMGHKIESKDVGNGKWKVLIDGEELPAVCESEAEAMAEGRDFIRKNSDKLSQGGSMDKEKLKKHLMDKKEMSEEDADKHLAALSEEDTEKLSAEVKEEEDKLAAEEEAEKAKLAAEEAEKEEKEKEEKLSAARSQLTKLSAGFKAAHGVSQLAAAKGKILTRLAKLRSEAKITPAEIKKMDLDKLSKEGDKAIDLVLKTYENREPVIMTGVLGSLKADELHTLTGKIRMSRLEAETRANMSLLRKTVKPAKKLSDGTMTPEEVNVHIDTTPHVHQDLEAAYGEMCKLMDEGRTEECKAKMKEWMKKSMSNGAPEAEALSMEETEKQLASLAESVNKMQTQFEELHKLTASLVGAEK